MINDAKRTSWSEFVAASSDENPYSLAYKIANNKIRTDEVLTSLKGDDGEDTRTVEDTLERLVSVLLPGDNVDEEEEYHIQVRRDLNEPYEAAPEREFILTELKEAIRLAKAKRAPGPDEIPIETLKNLSEANLIILLDTYNMCWIKGIFPNEWKTAKLKVIRKAGERDWSDPKSYRPISLLSVLGKTLERLIAKRLRDKIDEDGGMKEAQYGFRPGKSTVDAILSVTNYVGESGTKYVIGLFLDISGAFDGVWWPGVLHKLRTMNVSKNVY
ncbi:hypothetical protein J6590_108217 [Homalodisca vitripennis]|nr:hypothetical protein J6590_108217 [Homalodisca vitripennis]